MVIPITIGLTVIMMFVALYIGYGIGKADGYAKAVRDIEKELKERRV